MKLLVLPIEFVVMKSIAETKTLLFGEKDSRTRREAELEIEKYVIGKQERSFPHEMKRRVRIKQLFSVGRNSGKGNALRKLLKKKSFRSKAKVRTFRDRPDEMGNYYPFLVVSMVGRVTSSFGQKKVSVKFSSDPQMSTDGWNEICECYWENGYAGVGQEVLITSISGGKIFVSPV